MSEPEVRVKLKRGAWEVEIIAPENKLKEAIESVLAGLSSSNSLPEPPSRTENRAPATCRGLIERLWMEGWFSEQKSLAEVHEELGRRGYHYDRTAVSHSLTDLVRENILSREGSIRNYRYIQKKPPVKQEGEPSVA